MSESEYNYLKGMLEQNKGDSFAAEDSSNTLKTDTFGKNPILKINVDVDPPFLSNESIKKQDVSSYLTMYRKILISVDIKNNSKQSNIYKQIEKSVIYPTFEHFYFHQKLSGILGPTQFLIDSKSSQLQEIQIFINELNENIKKLKKLKKQYPESFENYPVSQNPAGLDIYSLPLQQQIITLESKKATSITEMDSIDSNNKYRKKLVQIVQSILTLKHLSGKNIDNYLVKLNSDSKISPDTKKSIKYLMANINAKDPGYLNYFISMNEESNMVFVKKFRIGEVIIVMFLSLFLSITGVIILEYINENAKTIFMKK